VNVRDQYSIERLNHLTDKAAMRIRPQPQHFLNIGLVTTRAISVRYAAPSQIECLYLATIARPSKQITIIDHFFQTSYKDDHPNKL
jgi:hypothetical protein